MRGIPKKIATREDVINLAWGLPAAQAKAFLDGLKPKDLKRVKMATEEYYIIKSQIGEIRWKEQIAGDRALALGLAHEEARMAEEVLAREYNRLIRDLQVISPKLSAAKAETQRLAGLVREVKNG